MIQLRAFAEITDDVGVQPELMCELPEGQPSRDTALFNEFAGIHARGDVRAGSSSWATDTRDYINWGFWTSVDRYPSDVTDLHGEDVIRLALDMTPRWHPNMRRLFELSDPGSAFSINIRTSEPIEPWESSNVTLLGDAIHTMTPGQGVGANTALRDAALLSRHLAAASEGSTPPLEAIADYEAEMVPYGFARVADSLAQNGTSSSHPLYKPVVGRVLLALNRTYFRAVDRIPSFRRKFLADLYSYRGA